MRYAIITDTHLGVRNDNQPLADYQDQFYLEQFFPKVKDLGITNLLHLGDYFDKRQFITLKTMDRNRNLLKLLETYNLKLDIITGNHDVLYRNTNAINSPDLLMQHPNVTVHSEPIELGNVLLIPWINKENYSDTLQIMDQSDAKYCMGHFEIAGFEMHRGQVCESGLDMQIFHKFDQVFSGHFHTRSERGNIKYLGSPFEMTWADFNDPKGFHIFDTDTGKLDFIPNEISMFFRCEYHGAEDRRWLPYRPEDVTNKFVKVIVQTKGSAYEFDKWLKKLYSYGPADISVVESAVDITEVQVSVEDLSTKVKTNMDLITEFVSNIDDLPKDKQTIVLDNMRTLYAEANVE